MKTHKGLSKLKGVLNELKATAKLGPGYLNFEFATLSTDPCRAYTNALQR